MSKILKLLKISWRNVFHNRRRSTLTLMILVSGSSCLLAMGGFLDDLLWNLRETTIHGQLGHFLASPKGYWERGSSTPFNFLIKDADRVQRAFAAAVPDSYSVPRIKFGGLLSSDSDGVSVVALGVDPAAEQRMGSYVNPGLKRPVTNVVQGKDLDANDPYGILLGEGLVKMLNLKVGDSVTFISTRPEGAIDGSTFRVRGVFQTIIKDVGERLVKLPLKTAQEILGIPNQVNSFLIVLQDTDLTEPTRAALANDKSPELAGLEILPWSEQSIYYNQSKDFLDNLFLIVKVVISLIFIVSIANTVNMALFERMKEYGTMMAIGNSRWTIFNMIVFEAVILGLVGSLFGLLVGYGITRAITGLQLQIPPPPTTGANDWFFINFLLTPRLFVQVFLISFLSAVVSAILPAYRASHIRIVQALGYV